MTAPYLTAQRRIVRCPLRSRRLRGGALVEALVALCLFATCLIATVKLWTFGIFVTQDVEEYGIAYSLGRQALERVKQGGFATTAEGTWDVYYDAWQGNESSTQVNSSRYKVRTTLTSDRFATNSVTGALTVSSLALRAAVVTVTNIATNKVVYTGATNLSRAGI